MAALTHQKRTIFDVELTLGGKKKKRIDDEIGVRMKREVEREKMRDIERQGET